jgi:protein-S-isoprenylcysteine O-methyltransferase Ste14
MLVVRPLFYTDATATILFWTLYAVWIAGELVIAGRSFLRRGAQTRDRGSLLVVFGSVLAGFAVGSVLASAVPATTIQSGRYAVLLGGLLVMAFGIALRFAAVIALGRFFTVVVMTGSDQHVVETGPYRWIRHPSYTGTLLTITGVLLATTNWLGLVGILPALAGLIYRMHVEEQALSDQMGDAYRSYMGRTKRLVPFVY